MANFEHLSELEKRDLALEYYSPWLRKTSKFPIELELKIAYGGSPPIEEWSAFPFYGGTLDPRRAGLFREVALAIEENEHMVLSSDQLNVLYSYWEVYADLTEV